MDGKFVADALATMWLPAIVILMLGTIAGRWVVLGKMGRRRWAAIIPIVAYPLLVMDGKVYLGPVDGVKA